MFSTIQASLADDEIIKAIVEGFYDWEEDFSFKIIEKNTQKSFVFKTYKFFTSYPDINRLRTLLSRPFQSSQLNAANAAAIVEFISYFACTGYSYFDENTRENFIYVIGKQGTNFDPMTLFIQLFQNYTKKYFYANTSMVSRKKNSLDYLQAIKNEQVFINSNQDGNKYRLTIKPEYPRTAIFRTLIRLAHYNPNSSLVQTFEFKDEDNLPNNYYLQPYVTVRLTMGTNIEINCMVKTLIDQIKPLNLSLGNITNMSTEWKNVIFSVIQNELELSQNKALPDKDKHKLLLHTETINTLTDTNYVKLNYAIEIIKPEIIEVNKANTTGISIPVNLLLFNTEQTLQHLQMNTSQTFQPPNHTLYQPSLPIIPNTNQFYPPLGSYPTPLPQPNLMTVIQNTHLHINNFITIDDDSNKRKNSYVDSNTSKRPRIEATTAQSNFNTNPNNFDSLRKYKSDQIIQIVLINFDKLVKRYLTNKNKMNEVLLLLVKVLVSLYYKLNIYATSEHELIFKFFNRARFQNIVVYQRFIERMWHFRECIILDKPSFYQTMQILIEYLSQMYPQASLINNSVKSFYNTCRIEQIQLNPNLTDKEKTTAFITDEDFVIPGVTFSPTQVLQVLLVCCEAHIKLQDNNQVDSILSIFLELLANLYYENYNNLNIDLIFEFFKGRSFQTFAYQEFIADMWQHQNLIESDDNNQFWLIMRKCIDAMMKFDYSDKQAAAIKFYNSYLEQILNTNKKITNTEIKKAFEFINAANVIISNYSENEGYSQNVLKLVRATLNEQGFSIYPNECMHLLVSISSDNKFTFTIVKENLYDLMRLHLRQEFEILEAKHPKVFLQFLHTGQFTANDYYFQATLNLEQGLLNLLQAVEKLLKQIKSYCDFFRSTVETFASIKIYLETIQPLLVSINQKFTLFPSEINFTTANSTNFITEYPDSEPFNWDEMEYSNLNYNDNLTIDTRNPTNINNNLIHNSNNNVNSSYLSVNTTLGSATNNNDRQFINIANNVVASTNNRTQNTKSHSSNQRGHDLQSTPQSLLFPVINTAKINIRKPVEGPSQSLQETPTTTPLEFFEFVQNNVRLTNEIIADEYCKLKNLRFGNSKEALNFLKKYFLFEATSISNNPETPLTISRFKKAENIECLFDTDNYDTPILLYLDEDMMLNNYRNENKQKKNEKQVSNSNTVYKNFNS